MRIPTPDGDLLADVYRRPDDASRPVLLQYTAYNKSNWASVNGVIGPTRAVERGFTVVVVDALGRFASGGDQPYRPFSDDGRVGANCIEWIAAQPWCDGSVGMYGASNNGVPQWQVARFGAPALKAIAPHFTASEFEQGWVYRGGVFQLGFNLWWTFANLGPDLVARATARGDAGGDAKQRLAAVLADPESAFGRLPLDALAMEEIPHYHEWLERGADQKAWRDTSLEGRWSTVALPVLHIAGWYNVHLDGSLANYVRMRTEGAPSVRDQQHLIIGPWTQWAPGLLGDSCGPERRFPTGLDMEGLQLDWFDHHLAGGPKPELARVRAYVMGANTWVDLDDWPPPSAVATELHLRSAGDANGREGGGRLSWTSAGEDPADSFLYDPRRPVPSIGGAAYLPNPHANAGMRDQRSVEDREDVLIYTTDPLAEPMVVVGPVSVTLHVTSTAPATDFTAKLVEVHLDGSAMLLCDGIQRASGLDSERPSEVEIDMTATGVRVEAGNRLRLEVSSSSFPRYARHTNTASDPSSTGLAQARPALQSVHHDRDHPSRLTLSVLPPGAHRLG